MALLNPPRHKITNDAKMEYIFELDTAWDRQKCVDEWVSFHASVEDEKWKTMPPWVEYMYGHTRFDLSLLSDYIDQTKSPVIFEIRRLSLDEIASLQSVMDRKGEDPAYLEACRIGIKHVENVKGLKVNSAINRMTPEDLEKIKSLVGYDGLIELGMVIAKANEPLKKK